MSFYFKSIMSCHLIPMQQEKGQNYNMTKLDKSNNKSQSCLHLLRSSLIVIISFNNYKFISFILPILVSENYVPF